MLVPYPLPDPDVVHDDIEEKEIPSNSSEECYEESIDNSFSLSFCLVDRTDSLRAEVPDESYHETEKSEYSKVPFVVSIQIICERSRKWHTSESEGNNHNGWETAEWSKCDTWWYDSDEFFHGI